MGTSRRYAHLYDRRMGEKILKRVMAESTPSSLKDEELELDVQPLTKPPRAIPVTAWIRYGGGERAVRVEGQAVAWTARAVAVEWKTPEGRVHRVGVGFGRERTVRGGSPTCTAS